VFRKGTVILKVELPDLVWGRLVSAADAQGVRSEVLVADAIARLVPSVTGRNSVAALWERGLSDAEIGRELGWTNAQVARSRKRLGLAANSWRARQKEQGSK